MLGPLLGVSSLSDGSRRLLPRLPVVITTATAYIGVYREVSGSRRKTRKPSILRERPLYKRQRREPHYYYDSAALTS